MSFRRLHQLCGSVIPALTREQLSLKRPFGNCRRLSGEWGNESDDEENYENSGKLIQMVVTSLRVDRVAASGLGLARRKVDHSLLAGHVFLNGRKVIKKSNQVTGGDIIDRVSENQPKPEEIKFGQVKVVNIGELTKKGNYHIEILRNKSLSLSVQEFWKNHK